MSQFLDIARCKYIVKGDKMPASYVPLLSQSMRLTGNICQVHYEKEQILKRQLQNSNNEVQFQLKGCRRNMHIGIREKIKILKNYLKAPTI